MALKNKKSLGQHWLRDKFALDSIADAGAITPEDTIVEVGPGLGTLTSVLLKRAKRVVSVEFDEALARKLPGQFPGKNLEVVSGDFLEYSTEHLPVGYKVVANVPYYITSKIIQKCLTDKNRPSKVVLLVQKEVAERAVALDGSMSVLAVSVHLYAKPSLGEVVGAELFTPPPKVDSQVLVLDLIKPDLPDGVSEKAFFRVVKAGFSAKRKKLRSSLSGGLGLDKSEIEAALESIGVSGDDRAERLNVDDWKRLAKTLCDRV